MPIIVADNSADQFQLPPEGQHPAVCVDILDLGLVETEWGQRAMVEIRWQIEADGVRYLVRRRFGKTLHERGQLRPFLEAWRGQAFTPDELRGFDLERLIGANALLTVVHRTTERGTFANVIAAARIPRGLPRLEPRDYVRVRDRVQHVPAEEAEL